MVGRVVGLDLGLADPAWEAMVASAQAGAFDVLVVGYVSRFLRNLKQTLIAVEDHLTRPGVVVLFADERLLSSDPGNWDQFVREAHEAEAYSRKLSKRVGEGYGAKRRRLGVPGGNRAPFGIIREGQPSTLRIERRRRPRPARLRARRHRRDGLGGRGRHGPQGDPRRRDPHEPGLRRSTPHR